MSGKAKVTAYELDPSVVGNTDAHPFVFGGFPGRWQVGRPVLPDALGLTVTRMRELIKEFNLPLVEVKVEEKDAHDSFEVPAGHIAAGASVNPIQDPAPMIEIRGQLQPGPLPSARMPDDEEAAAAQATVEGDAETAAGASESDSQGSGNGDGAEE